MFRVLTDFLIKLLSPTRCLGCNKFGLYFCRTCLRKIVLIDKQKCPVCEKLSVGGKSHPKCKGRYTLDGLFSFFKYQGIIRSAITQLKFKRLTDIRQELTRLINFSLRKFYEEDILVELEDFIVYDKPAVVPIPLHWLRKMGRKFNQAEFIAELIACEYFLLLIPDLLVRIKNTKQQTKLKGKERKENVRGVFKVRNKYLSQGAKRHKGKKYYTKIDESFENILLIDDVTTTVSTLKSAANTLKRFGVKKVWAVTLAS